MISGYDCEELFSHSFRLGQHDAEGRGLVGTLVYDGERPTTTMAVADHIASHVTIAVQIERVSYNDNRIVRQLLLVETCCRLCDLGGRIVGVMVSAVDRDGARGAVPSIREMLFRLV